MLVVGAGKTQIPIRSIWLLLIYASDMFGQLRSDEREAISSGDHDADLIGAIAEVLVTEVESRLRQQLSFQYLRRRTDLSRVRGRIDHLRTASHRLLDRGRIACTFEELTIDSPRNRFVAAMLRRASALVASPDLRQRCATADFALQRLGVSVTPPSRGELSRDRLARHQSQDRRMLDAAQLVHQMALPFHSAGSRLVPRLIRDEAKYRKLFEAGVRGFYEHALQSKGWVVKSPQLLWRDDSEVAAAEILPRMQTDIVLLDPLKKRRIVVETKFKDAFAENRGKTTFNRDFVFQLYAYLQSQSGFGDLSWDDAEGVLLFPVANGRKEFDQTMKIQGHRIRFLSVDMAQEPNLIRSRWLRVVEPGNVLATAGESQ
jgi:5-methylcytosine-specific restriction enzyme subunit McrC